MGVGVGGSRSAYCNILAMSGVAHRETILLPSILYIRVVILLTCLLSWNPPLVVGVVISNGEYGL